MSEIAKATYISTHASEEIDSLEAPVWYIFTTPDPLSIETLLLEENVLREQSHRSPFQYFVPYSFLKRQVSDELPEERANDNAVFNPRNRADVVANNELRSALKRYVFIKAPSDELVSLLSREDLSDSFRTLWFYRNSSRQPVTVSDGLMERFIDACCDKRIQFEVWPAIENIEENDEVVLNITSFRGYKAKVLEVHTDRRGELSLTVGFHLFQGAMLLKLPHLRMQDLLFEHKDASPATRETNRYKFVEDTQRRLFAIWQRRQAGKQSFDSFQKDVATLDLLNTYRYRFFVSPAMRRKFRGLMLLCAVLRGQPDDCQQLVAQVRNEINDINQQPDGKQAVDTRAFLHTMLFLAQGQESDRTIAFDYLTHHPKPTEVHKVLMRMLCFVEHR